MKTTLLLFTFLIISLSGISQTKNFIDQPYIETTANVDTLVTPDRIYMGIVIREKDTKGKISLEELELKMKNSLNTLGINIKEKLTLYDLTSNFKKHFINPKNILKNKSYRLLVEDAVMAGKVMIELGKIDISNIKIAQISHSRIAAIKLELKTKAIIKAKQQAVYMTKPLGQKVGTAIYISDILNATSQNVFQEREYDAFKTSTISYKTKTGQPDIQFDKIKVESTINVKFKLE